MRQWEEEAEVEGRSQNRVTEDQNSSEKGDIES